MREDVRNGLFQRQRSPQPLQDEHPQRHSFGVDHPAVGPQLGIELFRDLGRLNQLAKQLRRRRELLVGVICVGSFLGGGLRPWLRFRVGAGHRFLLQQYFLHRPSPAR